MADVIDVVNDLIATCRDSEEGFGKAAKGAHSDSLRTRFTSLSAQRSDFADELAQHVRELGGEPAASGHLSGIQHRGWRELESKIRPKDDASFITDCETGEENTLSHYQEGLRHDLPPEVRSIVEHQRLSIEEGLLELRELVQQAR